MSLLMFSILPFSARPHWSFDLTGWKTTLKASHYSCSESLGKNDLLEVAHLRMGKVALG